jgi:hypothetical protein
MEMTLKSYVALELNLHTERHPAFVPPPVHEHARNGFFYSYMLYIAKILPIMDFAWECTKYFILSLLQVFIIVS